jgi:hypothetical protein
MKVSMTIPSTRNNSQILLQIILVLVICAGLGFMAYRMGFFKRSATSHRITFRVESTSGYAIITYKDVNNEETEGQTVNTPWERNWINPKNTQVYLTAGNPVQSGTIKCFLKVDGKNWKTDSATSPDDKVACAGIVP